MSMPVLDARTIKGNPRATDLEVEKFAIIPKTRELGELQEIVDAGEGHIV
jgi:hypothetical protein